MRFWRWRKMTWVMAIWAAIIIAWVAAGVNSAQCEDEEFTSACEAGTGIGVGLVILFGFLGFFVLGIIWFATRSRRHCPACVLDEADRIYDALERGEDPLHVVDTDELIAALRQRHPRPDQPRNAQQPPDP